MKNWVVRVLVLGLILGLVVCVFSKFKIYDGSLIMQVIVKKGECKMYMVSGNCVVKVYDIGLGMQFIGYKNFEGDGKIFEGVYYIDCCNLNSCYYLFVGVFYFNLQDIVFVLLQG